MSPILQVALGGAVGAVARYLTGLWAARVLGTGFPWGTLIVNVAGGLAMGLLAAGLVQGDARAPLLMAGLLGGFTTFSAFSLEVVGLIERGAPALALAYAGGSVVLAVGAAALGLWLARGLA